MNLHDIFPSSPAPPQSYPGVDPGFVGPRAYSTWGPHVLKNNTQVQNEGKSEYYVELIKKSRQIANLKNLVANEHSSLIKFAYILVCTPLNHIFK